MTDQLTTIVPRRRRDQEPPEAPLDPFVSQFVRWIDEQDSGVVLAGLSKRAAEALAWPLPFTDAILTATRSRRLLALVQSGSRGGYRVSLSRRGHEWLASHSI